MPTPAPKPSAPPTPDAKAQSAKLARDAVDQLQGGEESIAKTTLEQAIRYDPGNELAHKLLDQIKADAQQELGPVFFRYTVQSEDTLSKLAKQFLNDNYRFYILAKYNDLRVPNRLAVGQVIKIPGLQPKTLPPAARPIPRPPPVPAPIPPPDPPKPAPPVTTPDAEVARRNAIQRLNTEAETCQRKQDLDCAIQKWTKVLELDPANQSALLKREKAATLKQQLQNMPAK